MADKKLKTRIQLKHDTAANWSQATNFIPLIGEIIIYDADTTNSAPRVKIGDGETVVAALPFISNADEIATAIAALDANDPSASGTSTTFISTVSQTDGVISATKSSIPTASGTTLGMVKGGGDVTISSGVITVTDNSHKHTSANISDLGTTIETAINNAVEALDVSEPAASGTSTTFIATAKQTNGVIEVTKASIPTANGTTMGMVKQGGDVTIASGVITVNDDSHNHVISNVDGLQTALDAKATPNDITTAVAALDYTGATASGNATSFITQVTQTDGVVSATKASIPIATASQAGLVKSGTDITVDSSGNVSVVNDSHTHTSAKITDLETVVDGYIADAIAALDATSPAANGSSISFIDTVSQTDGVISATKKTIPVATSSQLGLVKSGTDITVDSNGNVSVNNNSHTHTSANITDLSTTISTAITNAVNALDASDPAASGTATQFITSISQENGIIKATKANITAAALGLSGAMRFLGTSATAITDGATTNPITIGTTSTTVVAGNVVLYGAKEFVWTGSKWEELGNEGSYKVQQSAVSSPSASGNATAFIDSISQNAQGVITATKKNVTFPTLSGGSAAGNDATVIGGVTVSGHAVTVGKKTLTAGSNVTITGGTDSITIAAKDTTYTLGSFGITATAAELNKMDGVTATTAELNYVDGVTSNIQTQLNGKVPTSRTVNGKALSSNISLSASDVGAAPIDHIHKSISNPQMNFVDALATAEDESICPLNTTTFLRWYHPTNAPLTNIDGYAIIRKLNVAPYTDLEFIQSGTGRRWLNTKGDSGWTGWVEKGTLSDIGAAPAGYGLGETEAKILNSNNDLNTVSKSGWYFWSDSAPANAPTIKWSSNYGYMRVDGRSANEFTQTVWSAYSDANGLSVTRSIINGTPTDWMRCDPSAFAPAELVSKRYSVYTEEEIEAAISNAWGAMADNSTAFITISVLQSGLSLSGGNWHLTLYQTNYAYGTLMAIKYNGYGADIMCRNYFNSVWQPWEWVNPPLTGDETIYRTIERADGKAVYKKMDSQGKHFYLLDGSDTWTLGAPGLAPANVSMSWTLDTVGWYKIGTLYSAESHSSSATITIGETYYYQEPNSITVDISGSYNSIDGFVRSRTGRDSATQFTKMGIVMNNYQNFDVYLYYTNSQINSGIIKIDPTIGSFIKEDSLVAASLSDSDFTKIINLQTLSFALSSHSHSYLPLSGGTLTGSLSVGSDTSYNYCDFTVKRLSADGTIAGTLWSAVNANGTAVIGHNQNGTNVSKLTFGDGSATFANNLIVEGTIKENGTLLSSKYAPITHTHDIVGAARLLAPTDNTSTTTAGVADWNANSSTGKIAWRQRFTNSDLGTDNGAIVMWLSKNTSAGGVGLNITIDGQLYQNQDKAVLDSGNYSSYALPLSGGTLTGTTVAASTAVGTSGIRNIHAGTSALTSGSSSLTTGAIYIQYV